MKGPFERPSVEPAEVPRSSEQEEHFESIAEWSDHLTEQAEAVNTELQEELALAKEVRSWGTPVDEETKDRVRALEEKLNEILKTNEEIVAPAVQAAYKTVGATGELMLLGTKDVERLERAMEGVATEIKESELEPVQEYSAKELTEKQEALQERARTIEEAMDVLAQHLSAIEIGKGLKSPMREQEALAAWHASVSGQEDHIREQLTRYNTELERIYTTLGEIELNLGMARRLEGRA